MPRRRIGTPVFSLFSFQDIITSVTGIMILITLLMTLELIQRTMQSPQNRTAEVVASLDQQIAETREAIEVLRERIREQQKEQTPDMFLSVDTLQDRLNDIEDRTSRADRDAIRLARQRQTTTSELSRQQQEQSSRTDEARQLAELQKKLKEKQQQLQKLSTGNRVVYNPARGTSKTQWLVELRESEIVAARLGVSQAPHQFADVPGFRTWLSQLGSAGHYCMVLIRPSAVDRCEEVLQALDEVRIQYGYDAIDDSTTVIDPQTGAGI